MGAKVSLTSMDSIPAVGIVKRQKVAAQSIGVRGGSRVGLRLGGLKISAYGLLEAREGPGRVLSGALGV